MAISSINIQAAAGHCFAHNDRSAKVTYLVDDSGKNEFDLTAKDAKALLAQYVKEAEQYRKANGLRAMKSDTIKAVEAVVNLNAGHTLSDVQHLAAAIEKRFGFRPVQIAVHKDEGKDKQNKNYHAHIVFCNLTPEGTTIQRTLGRDGLKELQDITAQQLAMDRGAKGSTAVRMEHKQYKAMAKELEAKNAELEAVKYDFREMQKRITALEIENTALKRELHALNNAANKTKDAEQIAELAAKISSFETENISQTGGNTNTSTQTNNQTHTKTRSLKYGRINKLQQSNSNKILASRHKNGVQRMPGSDVVLNGSNTQMLLHESAFGRLRPRRGSARAYNRMRRPNFINSRGARMNTLYNDAELTEYQRKQMEAINIEGWWKALKGDKIIYKKDGLFMEDRGNELVVNGEDLEALARTSIELALKKGWKLEDIRVNGTDEFKKLVEDEIKRHQELQQKEEEKNKLTLGDVAEKIDDAVDAVEKIEDIKELLEGSSQKSGIDLALEGLEALGKNKEHGVKKIILDEAVDGAKDIAADAIKDFVSANPVSGVTTLDDAVAYVSKGAKTGLGLK